MPTPSTGALAARGLRFGGLMLVFIFTVALVASQNLGAGWWWDIAGGVGFVALALFALLNIATGQGTRLSAHKNLGWWAIGLTVLHAGLYLATDSVVVNHLKLAAPPAMLVGMATLVVGSFGAIISLSRWKLRAHGSRDNFRRYHRVMSWAVLTGSLYHVAATSHSVHQLWQMLLLGGGAFGLLLFGTKTAPRPQAQVPIVRLLLVSLLTVGCFVVVRNV